MSIEQLEPVTSDDLAQLQADISRFLLRRVTLGPRSGAAAAESAVTLARVIDQLGAARLDDLAVVQAEGSWAFDGSRSAAAWLAREERSSKGAAGADLKTARLLTDELPAIRDAVRDGLLPAEHAKAITRTCLRTEAMRTRLADPQRGEQFLLHHAYLGLDDFKRFLNAWAHRADPDAADAAYREGRGGFWVQAATTTEGVAVRCFLDPVAGEGFLTMLRAEIGVPSKHDTRDTPERMHDALAAITTRVLDGGTLGRQASVRPQIVIHVPLATALADPGTPGLAPAWLSDSHTPLPTRALDRVACDSEVLRAVIGAHGEILDFGRAKRLFSGPQRRALDARDGGCRWPGCHAPPSESEGHHRTRWVDGCLTDLDEGLLACWHHHDYIHANDVTIEHAPSGGLSFYDRHGTLIGITYPTHGPDPDPLPWPKAA